MQNTSLPRFLFLNEKSEQMVDKRIKDTKHTDPDTLVTKITKQLNSTIKFNQKPTGDRQLNRIVYSNALGLLAVSVEGEILITDYSHLDKVFSSADQTLINLKSISASIASGGKMYLTPSQTKILVVNDKQLMLFDLQKLTPVSRQDNQLKLRHYTFINQDAFVGWNFRESPVVFTNINALFWPRKVLDQVKTCSSISIINNNIVAVDKLKLGESEGDVQQWSQIYIFNIDGSKLINKVSLSQIDDQSLYLFTATHILALFLVKQQIQGQFHKNDVYAVILGMYDDFKQEPQKRYLSFMRGNLIEEGAQFNHRYFQLLQSSNQDETFYYENDPQTGEQIRLPFQVQIIKSKYMTIFMVQKLQTVFAIDLTLPFEKMEYYQFVLAHEIKLLGRSFFNGCCLMKNMLTKQKNIPQKSNDQTCQMICNDFGGKFLSLYFNEKQTQLTVPFPISILTLHDNVIQRKYVVQTIQSVEGIKTEMIKKQILDSKMTSQTLQLQKVVKIQPNKLLPLNFQLASLSGMKNSQNISPIQISKGNQQVKKQIAAPTFGKKVSDKPSASKIANLFGKNINQTNIIKPEQKKHEVQKSQNVKKQQTTESILFHKTLTTLNTQHPKNQQKNQKPILFGNMNKNTQQSGLFGAISSQKTGGSFSQTPITNQGGKLGSQNMNFGFHSGFNNLKVQQKETNLFGSKPKQTQQKTTQVKQKQKSIMPSIKPPSIQQPIEIQKSQASEQPKTSLFGLAQKKVDNTKKILQQKIIPNPLIAQTKINKNIIQPKTDSGSTKASKQKLNELALQLGYKCEQSLPPALKLLNVEQITALIQSLSSMSPIVSRVPQQFNSKQQQKYSKQQQKDSKQQKIRQKLLAKEHFNSFNKKINRVRQYVQAWKDQGKIIQQKNIFTLNNVEQTLRRLNNSNLLQQVNERPNHNLMNMIQNYTKRIQLLQNQYITLIYNQQGNRNPNTNPNDKQSQLSNKLSQLDEKVFSLQYQKNQIFPNKLNKLNNSKIFAFADQSSDKWVQILQKKAIKSKELIQFVNQQLYYLESRLQQSKNKIINKSINKSLYKSKQSKQKKKGLFKFTMDSSSNDSSNDQSSTSTNQNYHNFRQNFRSGISQTNNKNILIKFKPKLINLEEQITKITPLFVLNEKNQPSIMPKTFMNLPVNQQNKIQQAFSSNNLVNSSAIKKSIDFKQKIPMKKITENQKPITKRIDASEIWQQSDNDEFEQSDNDIPENFNRNISFAPQTLKQNQSTKPNIMPSIKKTGQTEVKNAQTEVNNAQGAKTNLKKINQDKQKLQKMKTQTFAFEPNGTNQKAPELASFETKVGPQPKQKIVPPTGGLFANTTTGGILGNGTPTGGIFGNLNVTGGLFTDNNAAKKTETNQTKKPQHAGLFTELVGDINVAKKSEANQTKKPQFGGIFTGESKKFSLQVVNKDNTASKPSINAKISKQSSQSSTSLYGQQNKLQQNKTAAEKKQVTKPSQEKPQTKSMFGDNKSKTIFGEADKNKPLFGQSNKSPLFGQISKQSLKSQKPNSDIAAVTKPSVFESLSNVSNLSNLWNSSKDAKKQAKTQKASKIESLIFGANKQQKTSQSKPSVPSLFGSQPDNIAAQKQAQNPSLIKPTTQGSSLFTTTNTTSGFGGQNKFLNENKTTNVANTSAFNPNQSGGWGNFGTTTTMKTFGNVQSTTQNTNQTSMFDKPNQTGNQPVAPAFGINSSLFGQNNAPNFVPSFGQNTSIQNLAGFSGNLQTTSLFGNGNLNQQNQNQQQNFLSSFNPNAGGGFPPVSSQDQGNLMKPRK